MKINRMIKWLLIILTVGILSACGKKSWLHDRSEDYVEAQSYPKLKIPADLHSGNFSQEYQIPGV